jgi:phytanoyl-CoA hydroxylase
MPLCLNLTKFVSFFISKSIEQFLEPERDFGPLLAEQAQILNELAAKLQREGLITSGYSDLPFTERLIKLCAESGKNFPQNFDITFPFAPGSIRPDTPIHAGPAVFGLLTNSRLLDLAEELVGPEIYSNPVQHIRMKLPKTALTKEYYSPDACQGLLAPG